MINMPNRPHIHMRLRPLKPRLRHRSRSLIREFFSERPFVREVTETPHPPGVSLIRKPTPVCSLSTPYLRGRNFTGYFRRVNWPRQIGETLVTHSSSMLTNDSGQTPYWLLPYGEYLPAFLSLPPCSEMPQKALQRVSPSCFFLVGAVLPERSNALLKSSAALGGPQRELGKSLHLHGANGPQQLV